MMAKAQTVVLDPRKMSDDELLRYARSILNEVLRRLRKQEQYITMLKNYKGCSVETTWVKNKLGRRYYYPYLKCRNGASVYLGNKPGTKYLVEKLKGLKGALKMYRRAETIINNALAELDTISILVSMAEEIREAEQEAKEMNKEAAKHRKKKLGRYLRRG